MRDLPGDAATVGGWGHMARMLRERDAQGVQRGAQSERTSQQVPHVPRPCDDGIRESPPRSQVGRAGQGVGHDHDCVQL